MMLHTGNFPLYPGKGQKILAWGLVGMTLILVWWGANVTTFGFGLAVPDWPRSFNSLNPDNWKTSNDVFWEHSHRLIAMTVGMLVAILFTWIWVTPDAETKPMHAKIFVWVGLAVTLCLAVNLLFDVSNYLYIVPVALFLLVFIALAVINKKFIEPLLIGVLATGMIETLRREQYVVALIIVVFLLSWWLHGVIARHWNFVKSTAAIAVILVVIQAALGGLRVVFTSDLLGIMHAILGQFFFASLLFLALSYSTGWRKFFDHAEQREAKKFSASAIALMVMVILQLLLGATMRHTLRNGLAIQDFPLANGKIIPALNDHNVAVHYFHRVLGLLIVLHVVGLLFRLRKREIWLAGRVATITKLLVMAIVLQFCIGACVIWGYATAGSALITNLHVLNGLFVFSLSAVLLLQAKTISPRSFILA